MLQRLRRKLYKWSKETVKYKVEYDGTVWDIFSKGGRRWHYENSHSTREEAYFHMIRMYYNSNRDIGTEERNYSDFPDRPKVPQPERFLRIHWNVPGEFG